MKMVKTLDAKGMALASDALNQIVLQKLVARPYSVSELSRELSIPALKLWRRIQRLSKAKLVEVTGAEKVGNLEKKLYRATALRYDVTPQFFKPKLNNPNLKAAFELYINIQKEVTKILSTFDNDIPKQGDPTDFAIYAHLQTFVQSFEKQSIQTNICQIKKMLANFKKDATKS
jgi:hypothetical protein